VKALLLPGCFPQPGNFDGKSTAFTENHSTQSFFSNTQSFEYIPKNKFCHVECIFVYVEALFFDA